MFDRILVALDVDDNYALLFEKALSLAQATGAELTLLSVLAPHYDPSTSLRYYPGMMGYSPTMEDSFWDNCQKEYIDRKERGFRILSDLSDRARRRGIVTDFFQKSGEPGPIICESAKSKRADLVMVSSHGRRGIEELLVGSVSNYVMHRAPCSVMVVHRSISEESMSEESVSEEEMRKEAATTSVRQEL